MTAGSVTSEIVEPYAKGLMAIGQAHDLVDRIGQDSNDLLVALEGSPDLVNFLMNPLIKAELKKSTLQRLFGETVHPYVMNFLMLLVDRGRIIFIEGVLKRYQALLRDLKGTVLSEVTSAVPLTDEQANSVRERVKAMTGAQSVELAVTQDPELLGGVIIQVGSQVIDASLRGQLRRIGLLLNSTSA